MMTQREYIKIIEIRKMKKNENKQKFSKNPRSKTITLSYKKTVVDNECSMVTSLNLSIQNSKAFKLERKKISST